jgi:hypothetical protein
MYNTMLFQFHVFQLKFPNLSQQTQAKLTCDGRVTASARYLILQFHELFSIFASYLTAQLSSELFRISLIISESLLDIFLHRVVFRDRFPQLLTFRECFLIPKVMHCVKYMADIPNLYLGRPVRKYLSGQCGGVNCVSRILAVLLNDIPRPLHNNQLPLADLRDYNEM